MKRNINKSKIRLKSFLEGLKDLFQFKDCDKIGLNTRGSTGDTPVKVAVVMVYRFYDYLPWPGCFGGFVLKDTKAHED
jgi:hypothetical protein